MASVRVLWDDIVLNANTVYEVREVEKIGMDRLTEKRKAEVFEDERAARSMIAKICSRLLEMT